MKRYKYPNLGKTRVLVHRWKPDIPEFSVGLEQYEIDNYVRTSFSELIRERFELEYDQRASHGFKNANLTVGGYGLETNPGSFHRDCEGQSLYLILWSNHTPTDILLPSGKLLEAEDGDVLLVDNRKAQHRIPIILRPGRRLCRLILY